MTGDQPAPTSDALVADWFEESEPLDHFERERLRDLVQDRGLRFRVARWTLWGLAGQLFVMDVAFGFYGYWNIHAPEFPSVFKWFLAGTLGEIFAIMWVLVHYLFPRRDHPPKSS